MATGKYDIPGKAQILADNPNIRDHAELIAEARHLQFSPFPQNEPGASRARVADRGEHFSPAQARGMAEHDECATKRGRKPVVTPERIAVVCGLLANGKTETAGCLKAGIGLSAWNAAKRTDAALRALIAGAREEGANERYQRHLAALYSSQAMRPARRKALKPRPIHQANMVAWHLTTRVSLEFSAISEADIASACEQFDLSLDRWERQNSAFGLLKKVYEKRARIRGEQPEAAQHDSSPPHYERFDCLDW